MCGPGLPLSVLERFGKEGRTSAVGTAGEQGLGTPTRRDLLRMDGRLESNVAQGGTRGLVWLRAG